MKMMAG